MEATDHISSRVEREYFREIEVLAEDPETNVSSVIRGLVILGLEKLGELVDEQQRAQDNLTGRLERLGFDEAHINSLFTKYDDLSELNSIVTGLERKKH